MMFVADRAPAAIGEIDERLRSRFEGGLVLQLSTGSAAPFQLEEFEDASGSEDSIYVPSLEEDKGGSRRGAGDERPQPVVAQTGSWFPSRENVVIYWPRLEDLLIEELD